MASPTFLDSSRTATCTWLSTGPLFHPLTPPPPASICGAQPSKQASAGLLCTRVKVVHLPAAPHRRERRARRRALGLEEGPATVDDDPLLGQCALGEGKCTKESCDVRGGWGQGTA